jgi:hypothetical protein
MFGFTAQMFATRPIPHKCQPGLWTTTRERGKGLNQFLDTLRGIQTSYKQHKFGLVVYGQLRARGAPVSQVKDPGIASIPDRPDFGSADTHLYGSLPQVLALGYNECCVLHRKSCQPSRSRVDESIQVRPDGANDGWNPKLARHYHGGVTLRIEPEVAGYIWPTLAEIWLEISGTNQTVDAPRHAR